MADVNLPAMTSIPRRVGDEQSADIRPLHPSAYGLVHAIRDRPPLGDEGRRGIWSGESQAFDVGTLKQVMLVRGFTAETLAHAAGIGRGTMYNALAGRSTRITTARRILEALAAVEPTIRLSEFVLRG